MLAAAKIWHGPATLKDSMASHGDATDANAKTGASGPQFAKAASFQNSLSILLCFMMFSLNYFCNYFLTFFVKIL